MTDKKNLMEERRQYERLQAGSTLLYSQMNDLVESMEVKPARLCDFSGGGVRFLTNEMLDKNLQLVLDLEFAGWRNSSDEWVWTGRDSDVGRLKALGVVMWCSANGERSGQYEVGVRFIGRVKSRSNKNGSRE